MRRLHLLECAHSHARARGPERAVGADCHVSLSRWVNLVTNTHEIGRPSRRNGCGLVGPWGQPLGTRSLGRHLGRSLQTSPWWTMGTVTRSICRPWEQGETEGAGLWPMGTWGSH